MKMQVLVRVQVEMVRTIEVEADEDGSWSIDGTQVLADLHNQIDTGGEWTPLADPDFEFEEMPGQPGRPR